MQAQLSLSAIQTAGVTIRYILFSELRQYCEALGTFDALLAAVRKVARSVS